MLRAIGCLVWLALMTNSAMAQADAYAPLRLYAGKWQMRPNKPAKPDLLENTCRQTGKFFVCEQTVNGKPGGLVTFLPAIDPGHYYTSPLTAEAQPIGRGDLTITGNHWEYSSEEEHGGATTWWRTVNDFSGDGNTIHFSLQKSVDGTTWKTLASGVETRVK